MESFGINIDCDEETKVIREGSFTNFLRNDIVNGIRLPLYNGLEYVEKPYISIPILFSRFHLLSFNTHLMENNSVITNCSTLKSLALNNDCKYILFPVEVEVESVSKTFYIFCTDIDITKKSPKKQHRNLHTGKRFEATLKEEYNINNYCTFACFHKKFNDPLVNLYYTHQIDLYDNEKNAIEVKSLYYNGDPAITAEQKLSICFDEKSRIHTVLQCKIGEVNKLIFGIHDGKEVEILQMDLEMLYTGKVKNEVDTGFARMKNELKNIFKKYIKPPYKGKAVRIQKVKTHTTIDWHFTPLNFLDLTESGLSYLTFA